MTFSVLLVWHKRRVTVPVLLRTQYVVTNVLGMMMRQTRQKAEYSQNLC